MKKIMIISGFMFIAVNSVLAQTMQKQPGQAVQQRMSAEQHAQMMTEKMSKLLQLSDKQKKDMYDVNLAEAKKIESAMQNHEKISKDEIMQQRENNYKRILTPEQLAKYQSMSTHPAPPPHTNK